MKTIAQIKELYSKMGWYKQGAAVRPLYIGYPWESCLEFTLKGKWLPFNYLPFGVYLKDDFLDINFPKENMKKVADFYYGRERKNPGFIFNLKKCWKKNNVAPLGQIILEAEQADLSYFSNKDLLSLFKKFTNIYVAFWREAIFLDAFDVMSDVILEQALEDEGKEIKAEDLQVLTSPEELSWLQKEKKELLELVPAVRRSKKLFRAIIKGKLKCLEANFPQFVKKMKAHARRYHWIYNDYAVIRRLDWKFFLKHLREFLEDRKIYKKEKRAINFVLETKRSKERLIKKLKLSPEFKRTINFLVALAVWRDWRKTYQQMASSALYELVKEFRTRTGFAKGEIEYLWWWEIKNIFKLKKRDLKQAWLRRRGMFSIGDLKKKDSLFFGKKAKELRSFMNTLLSQGKELWGKPAFAGLVRGRAKIIRTQKDFKKMKKGDILVAPNTRPEYVPIMKIAGAIISEEGGLTCHAAIVSRELKVPTIVGVQGAITVLKDGDLVEVDAKRGLVRRTK